MIRSIDESEQWRLGGLCSKCRRQKYCGSVCKAARESDRKEIQQIVASHIFGKFMNTVKQNYGYGKETYI